MASLPYRILKKYSNGVMDQKGKFYPFLVSNGTIAAIPNKRFYIDNVLLTAGDPINTAAQSDYVSAYVNGVSVKIAALDIPAIAAAADGAIATNNQVDCDMLCDLATAVTLTVASTVHTCVIRYAALDERSGEYA